MRRFTECGLVAGVVLVCAWPVRGGEYAFTDVVNSASGMRAFANPVINDRGTIGFFAATDESGGQHDVYLQRTDAPMLRLTSGGRVDAAFGLPINERDEVAFVRRLEANPQSFREGEVYRGGASAELSLIGRVAGEFARLEPALWITDAGQVLYGAQMGGEALLLKGPDPVADRVMSLLGSGWVTDAVLDDGTPVVRAREAGGWVFYKGVNRDEVAMRAGHWSLATCYQENARGEKIFGGSLSNAIGGERHGIYRGPDLVRDKIVDSRSAYEWIGCAAMNDAGTIVFHASLYAGGHGIFTGPDAVNDRVLAVGDELFGSEVRTVNVRPAYSVHFNTDVVNNLGQIVFAYELANGISGIGLATPVPEPTGVMGVVVGAAALLVRRRRPIDGR